MATITSYRTKKGEVRLHVRVRLAGHPTRCATFGETIEARRWAERVELELRHARSFARSVPQQRTVSELIDLFNVDGLEGLSRGHIQYRRAQLEWWRKQIGSIRVEMLTPGMIRQAWRRLEDRSTVTRRKYLSALSRVFRRAVIERWAPSNPVAAIDRKHEIASWPGPQVPPGDSVMPHP